MAEALLTGTGIICISNNDFTDIEDKIIESIKLSKYMEAFTDPIKETDWDIPIKPQKGYGKPPK
ncbi:hypothetical protein [Chryseobacterium sp.]|uniref:hypothetical protein n=1 Tax=Chryseobacterium sp. TaxID=1871047 RepID=UPI0032191AA5